MPDEPEESLDVDLLDEPSDLLDEPSDLLDEPSDLLDEPDDAPDSPGAAGIDADDLLDARLSVL